MKPRILILFVINVCLLSCENEKSSVTPNVDTKSKPWMLGFEKTTINPIMTADSSFVFTDPISDTVVQLQKTDVFNLGAIVRNDAVFMLFRAEDNPEAKLRGRTSCIGLAYSLDGIHFTEYLKPVLYPDKDEFNKWDYPGGIEDPRIIETPNGEYIMLYTSWNKDVARLSSVTSKDFKFGLSRNNIYRRSGIF